MELAKHVEQQHNIIEAQTTEDDSGVEKEKEIQMVFVPPSQSLQLLEGATGDMIESSDEVGYLVHLLISLLTKQTDVS